VKTALSADVRIFPAIAWPQRLSRLAEVGETLFGFFHAIGDQN
jgi:hypothetical protein